MRALSAFILVLCILIFPFYAYSCEVGEKAPAFKLKDLKGNAVTLESLKGKVVFIDFWATWCGPCKEELPELDALHRKFGKDGLEVVGISVDKSESNITEFLKERPVSFTILSDIKGEAPEAYGLPGMPTGYIIDKNGVVRHKHMGFSRTFLLVYEKEIMELLKRP